MHLVLLIFNLIVFILSFIKTQCRFQDNTTEGKFFCDFNNLLNLRFKQIVSWLKLNNEKINILIFYIEINFVSYLN